MLKKSPLNRYIEYKDRLLLYEDYIRHCPNYTDVVSRLDQAERRVGESYLNIVENYPPSNYKDMWKMVYDGRCPPRSTKILRSSDQLDTCNLVSALLSRINCDLRIGGNESKINVYDLSLPDIILPREVIIYSPMICINSLSEHEVLTLHKLHIDELGNRVGQLVSDLEEYINVYYEYWMLGYPHYTLDDNIGYLHSGQMLFLKDLTCTWRELLRSRTTRDLYSRLVELRSDELQQDGWDTSPIDKFKMSDEINNLLQDDFGQYQ